jgi:hypothetical protein
MDPVVSVPLPTAAPSRSVAERRLRRLLLLPEDAPRVSIFQAQSAFGTSIAISGVRCLLTYVLIPLVGPLVGVSGAVGPILGLVLGTVSMVAIFFATRRFFAADHKYRWWYAGIGGTIVVLLAVQAAIDISSLVS